MNQADGNTSASKNNQGGDLISYVMSRVKDWRQYRDDNYKEKWKEYYRLWRGIWDSQDKLRDSERSRLISPATQQAVEGTVAELEEATFGRDTWFDINDDIQDQDKTDIPKIRAQLKEDLEREKWPNAIDECFLNGSLYGTAIGEILVEEKQDYTPSEQPVAGTTLMARGATSRKYTCVPLIPISPFNFSIDPGARDIDSAHGCAVDAIVPSHLVHQGMKDGTYKDIDLSDYANTAETMMSGESRQVPSTGTIKITKYYGLCPQEFIDEFNSTEEEQKDKTDDEEETLVEALIVIANDSEIIKAVKSPYMMQDRPVVAYQHDRVPDRFWGRGVVEKGYNPQKALDTELRARADALALNTHPMMACDATRLPRGMKPRVQPGLTILTNGDPRTILMPFTFGNLNPVSYKESAELERMVTMGTGAMDSAAPTMVNPRNNTSSGMSMMMGASIKRQKRTLRNFQDTFLVPAIQKAAYRYMQFDPKRYPVKDYKFVPTSTMGIMAREYEQQQMTTLLQTMEPGSPPFMIVLKGIYENSSFQNRDELVAAIDQHMQQSAQPQQPDPAAMGQVQAQHDQNKLQATKVQLDDMNKKSELGIKGQELQLKAQELQLKAQELQLRNKELDLANLQAQAETALKELDIHLKANAFSQKHAIDAENNAQDNTNNAVEAHMTGIKDMMEKLSKGEKLKAPPINNYFMNGKKTIKVKSPLTGTEYVGEISPESSDTPPPVPDLSHLATGEDLSRLVTAIDSMKSKGGDEWKAHAGAVGQAVGQVQDTVKGLVKTMSAPRKIKTKVIRDKDGLLVGAESVEAD